MPRSLPLPLPLPLPLRCAAALSLALSLNLGLAPAARGAVPVCGVEVVRAYPHDRTMFTEGLLFRDGLLYESSGREGASRIVVRRLDSARPLRVARIDPRLFGEGLIDWGDQLISLTWRNGVGLRWNRRTLKLLNSFLLDGEGWGMTRHGGSLYQSDGSARLLLRDPLTMAVRARLPVSADGVPVANLNELEWIEGEIWANVWMTDRIARIDPATGRVKAWIDLSGLVRRVNARDPDDVLNGIAYDAAARRVFVTGKNWPALFHIRLDGRDCPPR